MSLIMLTKALKERTNACVSAHQTSFEQWN